MTKILEFTVTLERVTSEFSEIRATTLRQVVNGITTTLAILGWNDIKPHKPNDRRLNAVDVDYSRAQCQLMINLRR